MRLRLRGDEDEVAGARRRLRRMRLVRLCHGQVEHLGSPCTGPLHSGGGAAGASWSRYFRDEGAKLVPPPRAADPYEDEAYRLWALKQRAKKVKAPDLSSE